MLGGKRLFCFKCKGLTLASSLEGHWQDFFLLIEVSEFVSFIQSLVRTIPTDFFPPFFLGQILALSPACTAKFSWL